MSTHPYIPLYVDDYEAATTHLSVEEDGAYCRLIRLCWRTPGCSLPNDDAWLSRKLRLSMDDFERIVRPVIGEFFSLSRGRLIQKRLKREYDDISRKKSARKLAGKKGGDAKALKTNDKEASNATVLPADTRAFPEPYPEPERKELLSPSSDEKQPAAYPPLFELAWKAYPHVKGRSSKPKTLLAWKKLPTSTRQALPAAVIEYAAKGSEPRMDCGAPDMGRWVREERFNDWLRDVTPSNAPAAPVSPEIEAQRLRHFRDTGEWKTSWGPTPKNIAA